MDLEGLDGFGGWIVRQDWSKVLEATGSNAKAEAYQSVLSSGVSNFFPMKTSRRKDTDPQWINNNIWRKIRRRRAIYRAEGRLAAWKNLKKDTVRLI